MASIQTVRSKHGESWFVSWYVNGVKKRGPVTHIYREAQEQKALKDLEFPKKKHWKHRSREEKEKEYLRPDRKISSQCCFRAHKIAGEAHAIDRVNEHGKKVHYACCDQCYRDFELGVLYKTPFAAREKEACD